MGAHDYEGLKKHVGHNIVCVQYGSRQNVSVECADCHEVIIDFDNPNLCVRCGIVEVDDDDNMVDGGRVCPKCFFGDNIDVTDKVYNASCELNSARSSLISALSELPKWDLHKESCPCECDEPIIEYIDVEGSGDFYEVCLRCGGDIE